MITEDSQLISRSISAKSEIPLDHAAPRVPVPRVSLHMVLTVTTHH
jgi:hypothetical protein